jgi:hypothetical protein
MRAEISTLPAPPKLGLAEREAETSERFLPIWAIAKTPARHRRRNASLAAKAAKSASGLRATIFLAGSCGFGAFAGNLRRCTAKGFGCLVIECRLCDAHADLRWRRRRATMPARAIRPKAYTRWHLDEMVVSFSGKQMYMWRAVDGEGEVLEILVQPRRDKAAGNAPSAHAPSPPRLCPHGCCHR